MIDTHAHLQFEPLSTELPNAVLERAKLAGVNKIINVASDVAGSFFSVKLAQQFPEQVYASVGVHPHDAQKADLEAIESLIKQPGVIAVGECGLDYYYQDNCPKDIQKEVFEKQILLAIKYQKPLIVHNREADQDVFNSLKDLDYPQVVYHCYSRSIEYTKQLLDLGFMVSFTGNITFPKNLAGREAVKYVPLDRLMLETDCPYMAPVPNRGKPNEPAYLKYVALEVAALKGVSLEEVIEVTTTNARRFFKI